MFQTDCQLHDLVRNGYKISSAPLLFQRIRKMLFKSLPKRINFLSNLLSGKRGNPVCGSANLLKAGDTVTVLSREEISATLDSHDRLGSLYFDNGMWKYCGMKLRVLKPVVGYMDEGTWTFRKAKNCVLLENCYCDGKMSLGQCDRACPFFWRLEWLKRVN